MSFFNKKEEVLDVQLTQLGKYLLSKGKLKPMYYAFSDDEILYDVDYAGGIPEVSRQTSTRIQKDTQRLKTLYEHDGVESRVLSLNGHKVEKARGHGWQARVRGRTEEMPLDKAYGDDFINQEKMGSDDRNLIRNFIGNSTIGERTAPSWNVESLFEGLITDINISSSSPNVGIKRPVIDFEIEYEIDAEPRDSTDIQTESQNVEDLLEYSHLEEDLGKFLKFKDGYDATVSQGKIILSVIEENVDFDLENFEYEIFEVEGTYLNESANNASIEKLKRLYFGTPPENGDQSMYIETYFDIASDNDVGTIYETSLFGTNPFKLRDRLKQYIDLDGKPTIHGMYDALGPDPLDDEECD